MFMDMWGKVGKSRDSWALEERWTDPASPAAQTAKASAALPPVFNGTHERSLDDKKRLFIPSVFRKELREGPAILTVGLEQALSLYPSRTWQEKVRGLTGLTLKRQDEARMFKRYLLSQAQDAEMDSSGRLRIPQTLARHAALKRDAVILGNGDRIEIWAKERWSAYQKRVRRALPRLSRQIEI